MTSLLSIFGSSITSIHMFSKLYNLPEFKIFMQTLNDNTSVQVMVQFFRNLICKTMDPLVENVLMKKENNLIFSNKSIDKETKVKLFVGKILNELYDDATILPCFIQLDMNKEDLISYFILTINDIKGLENANNGRDVYTLLVNYYALIITTFLKQTVIDQLFENIKEDNLLETINLILGQFNEIYHYESENICEDMLDSNYDESDYDESDDSDSDDSDSDSNNSNNSDNSNNSNNSNNSDDSDDSDNTMNTKKRKMDNTPLVGDLNTPAKKPKKN